MNSKISFRLLNLLLGCLLMNGLGAQTPGTLDTQFGTGGIAQASFQTFPSECRAIALQNDGKIILGGQYTGSGKGYMGFARFNTNGTLDNSFGTGGKSSPYNNTSVTVAAIQVLPDGKIIAAGTINNQPGIIRMTSAGALDNTFGTGGALTFDASMSGIVDLKVLDNGKMVGCGIADQGSGKLFAAFRLNANGTADNTFDGDGYAYANIGSQPTVTRLAVQSDGKIVLTGTVFSNATKYDMVLFRFNSNGTPDNTFGANGLVTTVLSTSSAYEQGNAVAIQWGDNKILVAGRITNITPPVFAVVRYNTNGTVDNTFGTSGVTKINFNNTSVEDAAKAIAFQSDGKIIVAGSFATASSREFALARLNKNGTVDNSFGTSGKVTTLIGTKAWGEALAIQSNGKIVVGGYALVSNLSQFAVARYNAGTIVGTEEAGAGIRALEVYPNPVFAGGRINLRLDLDHSQTCRIQWLATDGRLLQAEAGRELPAGDQTLSLEVPAGLPAGQALLNLETESGAGTRTVLIRR